MSRPLRVKYENACYHVINRGNRREVVFQDDSDSELFLEKLIEFAALYDVIIYSYCLLPNHFHLYIRTRHGNLSKFMQSFLTSFTLKMNRKYLKCGHLFQGRFKAQLVESELYKNKLSRYIHLNPVKTKSQEELSTKTLKSRLDDYKWSSYRFYIGLENKPEWLDRRFVLSSWGRTAFEKMHNYRNYVEKGIKTDNADDIRAAVSGGIIGSTVFAEEVIRKYLRHDISDIDAKAQPALAALNSFTVDEVLKAVAGYYQIDDIEKITVRRGCHSKARKTAMFLTGKHCRRKETLTFLATRFGVKISGFNMAVDKVKNSLKTKPSIQNDINNIENIMKSNKVEL